MSISVEKGSARPNPIGMGRWLPWRRAKAAEPSPAAGADGGSGAPPSWEELYRERFGYVWHVLHRLGVPLRHREDVAQEVFMAAHRSLPSFDASRPILPWLHGIAFHVAKRYLALARHHREVLMDEEVERPDSARDPERLAEAEQDRELLIELMQAIDVDRRVVLAMHDLDGIAMIHVARELRISLSAGYKRLETARRELTAAAARHDAKERRTAKLGAVVAVPFDLTTFLDADRHVPEAPGGVRARVWSRLQGALALGGAGATGGLGALAPSPAGVAPGLAVKAAPHVALFVAGAIAGAAGLYAAMRVQHAAPRPAVEAMTAQAAPAPAAVSDSGERDAGTVPAPATAGTAVVMVTTPTTPAPSRSEDEGALIQQARMAYAHGDLRSALAALDEHARRFRAGRMAADREALRAQVLQRQREVAAPAPTAPTPHRLFGTDE